MAERRDHVRKLEQKVGVESEGQPIKTRKVRIRGAHGILWEYTIGPEGTVIHEEALTDEETARRCTMTKEQGLREKAVWDIGYYTSWIGEHFPTEYPTLRDRLNYARDHVSPDDDEAAIYDKVFALLFAGLTDGGQLPEDISSVRELLAGAS